MLACTAIESGGPGWPRTAANRTLTLRAGAGPCHGRHAVADPVRTALEVVARVAVVPIVDEALAIAVPLTYPLGHEPR